MKTAITGATGLLGANLAEVLLQAGHEVVATRRASSKVDHLEDLEIDWREAALDNEDALARAFDGCELVFHCAAEASVRRHVTPSLTLTNVGGTGCVLRAVQRVGGARLVHTSSTVAVAISENGEPVDENARWNLAAFGLNDGYATTKHQAEVQVIDAARAGLVDAVVVNPGFMFGARDRRPSSGELLLNLMRGRIPGHTPGTNSFSDVLDVARGMLAAGERGLTGERYILAGENLSYRECFIRASMILGVKPPRLAVPRWVTRPVGRLFDLKEQLTGREAQLNSMTLRWAYARGFMASSEKAKRELGYSISPVDGGMERCMTWFRQRGMA